MIVQFSKPNAKILSLLLLLSACAQPPNYAPVKTVNQAVEPNNGYYLRNKIPVPPNISSQATTEASRNRLSTKPVEQQSAITVKPYAEAPESKLNQTYSPAQNTKKREFSDQYQKFGQNTSPYQKKNIQNNKHTQVDVNKGLISTAKKSSSIRQQVAKQPEDNSIISTRNAINTSKNSQSDLKLLANITPRQNKFNEKTSIISIDNKKMLKLNFGWPLRGKIFRDFIQTDNRGIDIKGKTGQPVHAAESGKIVYCGYGLAGLGNLAIIKHNNVYLSAYANNSHLFIKEGQQIIKGQTIGQVGSKLHFEIRKNGRPINPLTLLPKQ